MVQRVETLTSGYIPYLREGEGGREGGRTEGRKRGRERFGWWYKFDWVKYLMINDVSYLGGTITYSSCQQLSITAEHAAADGVANTVSTAQ